MPDEKIKFSIYRDAEKKPTVTVCEIRVNGSIGIGVAIRSLKDNPVEKIGKAKAFGRARKALFHRCNSLPVQSVRAFASLDASKHCGYPVYKSLYQEL